MLDFLEEYWVPIFWFTFLFLNPFFYIILGDLRDIALDIADRYENWKEDQFGEKREPFADWYERKHGRRPY